MIMVELTDYQVEWLLACKKTMDRPFENWSIQQLLHEAIYDFKEKYARVGGDHTPSGVNK